MNAPPIATTEGGSGEGRIAQIKERMRQAAHTVFEPLVRGLARAGVRPTHMTVLGLLLSLVAALAFFTGGFRQGAALLMLGGLCDILDGELARERHEASKFGAFLDSTLDRVGDGAVLAGIAGFYIANLLELVHDPGRVLFELARGLEPRTWAAVALTAIAALVSSFLVSYTRARAEGLGIDCRVGWFERPERLSILIVAGAFGVGPVMPGALLVMTVLSFVTAVQRGAYVWKRTRVERDPNR